MTTLIFSNPGEIDIRGATIAGLSAKESKSPIGFFGTGLKYSIACILRWGGEITIYSGTSKYEFTKKLLDFRDEKFQQICMNGEPLGFTTDYGKNWKAWQVFRELYANARDEGGNVRLDDGCIVRQGETTILVSGIPDLIDAFHDRHSIILPLDKRYDFENDIIQFANAPAKGIYYRGVRVWDQPTLYTHNFLGGLTLTEDRTINSLYTASHLFDNLFERDLHDTEIILSLLRMKFEFERFIEEVTGFNDEPVNLSRKPIEQLFMDWWSPPTKVGQHSQEFIAACKAAYARNPVIYSPLRSFLRSLDPELVKRSEHKMTAREQQMLDKAVELVAMFGFGNEVARLPISVQELGGSTLGLYENGSIYLSPKLFDQGTKQLVTTLYEECYHHRTANKDCTYDMQTDLFNIIISLNEELHGVIC